MAVRSFEQVLKEVSDRLDKACFDDELEKYTEALALLLNDKGPEDPDFWNARNMLAEVYDHVGPRERAAEVTKNAETLRKELEAVVFEPGADTLLRRAQIRHVLFWGQVEYRNQHFDKAEEIIKFCSEFVNGLLESQGKKIEWPHWKTRGLIAYFRGRVYRHQNKLKEAMEAFEESINCYYRRALDSHDDQFDYNYYRIAKALALGVGWVKLALGQYREALIQNLMPASIILQRTEDALNKNRALLLVATAEIGLADSEDKLERAVLKLREAKEAFKRHPHYAAKAARECCLALSRLGRFRDASANLKDFKDATSGDSGECRYQILNSLVELDQATRNVDDDRGKRTHAAKAEEAATKALTNKARLVQDEVEAQIARGRARLLLGQYPTAKEDFEKALQRAKEGPIIAACYLHLARTCARLPDSVEANSYLQRWTDIHTQIQDHALRTLADQVSREVAEVTGFVIGPQDDFIDFRSREHQLRRFLVGQATRRTSGSSDQQIADDLGVARPTVTQWKNGFKEEDKILHKLKRLCDLIRDRGGITVLEFEHFLNQHGAFAACRNILLEKQNGYETIYQLAEDHGQEALDVTVERIVERAPKTGLFSGQQGLIKDLLIKRLKSKA